MSLTRKKLRNLFRIDLKMGKLFWKHPSKYHLHLIGREAGTSFVNEHGKVYRVIVIDKKPYRRSHLIFFLKHGRFAYPQVDHRNRNSLDDRPCNLREATRQQNAWNHGPHRRRIKLPLGVRMLASGRYGARIGFNDQQLHLGSFATPWQAHKIYRAKRKELFHEFA